MSAAEDPYETLSLPRNATQSQVKASYRKLALKYHPDKQTSEHEKERCSEIFTKIGSAYEILGDQQRRSEYDRFGQDGANAQQKQRQQRHQNDDFFNNGSPFMNMHDPFAGRRSSRHNMESGRGGFTDPFDIFRQVFGTDFGSDQFGFTDFHDHSQTRPREEDFVEQQEQQHGGYGNSVRSGFGSNMGGFGMMGGMAQQQMNLHPMMAQQQMDMNSMMGMHSVFPRHSQNQQHGQRQSYSSSSSSSFQSGGGAMSESVSTTTRIVNGRRQTVTHRTVRKADGTVETTTETTGDDNFPSLNNGQGSGRLLKGNRDSSHR